jgi:hypothetical protein
MANRRITTSSLAILLFFGTMALSFVGNDASPARLQQIQQVGVAP